MKLRFADLCPGWSHEVLALFFVAEEEGQGRRGTYELIGARGKGSGVLGLAVVAGTRGRGAIGKLGCVCVSATLLFERAFYPWLFEGRLV